MEVMFPSSRGAPPYCVSACLTAPTLVWRQCFQGNSSISYVCLSYSFSTSVEVMFPEELLHILCLPVLQLLHQWGGSVSRGDPPYCVSDCLTAPPLVWRECLQGSSSISCVCLSYSSSTSVEVMFPGELLHILSLLV